MVVLGIDPGLHYAGYGIVKKDTTRALLLDAGCLTLNPKKSLPERIKIFHDFFDAQAKLYNITSLSLETPFLGKNAQNFLKLGYLRGVLYLIAQNNNMKIFELAPTEIKHAVTGYGAASKEQVARIMIQFFPGFAMPQKLDVTDALAITLCGLWKHTHNRSI